MSAAESRSTEHFDFKRDLSLLMWQTRYEQRAFWRNRQRGVFTFAFPLMFLVVFGSIYNGKYIHFGGHLIKADDFIVPGLLAYGVISASYVNLAVGTAILRDQGVLKRMQGTPLPRWVYIAARIASSAVTILLMALITFVFARVVYSIDFPLKALPAVVVTLVIGTAALTTLGIGVTAFIKSAEAAPVVANLTVLPLTFISGIWFANGNLPKVLQQIASFFPLKPLAAAMRKALLPYQHGAGFAPQYLRNLAIWIVIGALLMRKTLSTPEGDRD